MMSSYCACHLELKKLNQEGEFWGYASTRSIDQAGDQLLPGAFGRTLSQWKQKRGRYPHLYWEHDPEEFIGLCRELSEDEHGLYIQGKLMMEIPKAHHAYRMLKKGFDGLSIGFFTVKSNIISGVRKISEVELKEISLVSAPCNQEAVIYEYKIEHDLTHALSRLVNAIAL